MAFFATLAPNILVPAGAIDGTNRTFTLPALVTNYALQVNGLPLDATQFVPNGNSFTLAVAPQVGADGIPDRLTAIVLRSQL